jgi:hypothetical protein
MTDVDDRMDSGDPITWITKIDRRRVTRKLTAIQRRDLFRGFASTQHRARSAY